MICPHCFYECGALSIDPELGLICPMCRDKFYRECEIVTVELTEEERRLIEFMKNDTEDEE